MNIFGSATTDWRNILTFNLISLMRLNKERLHGSCRTLEKYTVSQVTFKKKARLQDLGVDEQNVKERDLREVLGKDVGNVFLSHCCGIIFNFYQPGRKERNNIPFRNSTPFC
jgi:hypothetical protein